MHHGELILRQPRLDELYSGLHLCPVSHPLEPLPALSGPGER